MINFNSHHKAVNPQQNQIAMQGNKEKKHVQTKPLENVLFDKPVENAKSFAISMGKIGFIVGTVSSFILLRQKRAEAGVSLIKDAKTLFKSATSNLKDIKPKNIKIKPAEIKKAATDFITGSSVKETGKKALGVLEDSAKSLVCGAAASIDSAFKFGLGFLAIGSLVKFAQNQTLLNEGLKSKE